jgi:aerobic-type carbon monoxide dehydrogenase small subunit (CoxS/CutS family)
MIEVTFKLNNKQVSVKSEEGEMLTWVLRDQLRLTGTKWGCGEAACGACTVLMDGDAVPSCQIPIEMCEGSEILTIEGVAGPDGMHPLQQAFLDYDAYGCGFCTPGMIMKALAFLDQNPDPSREEIIAAMNDNVCRCGAYNNIIKAIEAAAKEMRKVKA